MSNERIIPVEGDASVVTYTILVGGNELPLTYELLSITSRKNVNRIPTARVVFRDGSAALEDFELSNKDDLIPGKEIEIQVGYASQDKTIFKGIIVKHGIKILEGSEPVLVIDCRDTAVKMTIGRKNGYYMDKKDSDVISDLIKAAGLQATVSATQLQHKELIQYYTTDWDFMVSRADVNGMVVIVDDGAVKVEPPAISGEAALAVVHGDTIFEFEAEMDARHQYNEVVSKSWDYASQSVLEKKGAKPTANPQGNISESTLADVVGLEQFILQHPGHVIDQELQAWGDARLVKSYLAKITGRVKIQGFAGIKPGQLIELNGVGERFNGKAYVSGIHHELNQGTWYTHLFIGLSPNWFSRQDDIMDEPGGGLVPGLHGLQIGVVTKLSEDPDGEDRIQVKMPISDPESEGIWARLASLDAGNDRGFVFRPEIADEVVIGFLNGDPRDPVILGMLHSSAMPSPIPAADDNNHEKGLVTRSKIRVVFNDEKSIITIETPGKNSIVVDDDAQSITLTDQHSNSITMDSEGITIKASNIKMEADQAIELKAGTDLKAEGGANVEVKAGAQLKADGGAGTELTSSAVTTIKGSLVQIN